MLAVVLAAAHTLNPLERLRKADCWVQVQPCLHGFPSQPGLHSEPPPDLSDRGFEAESRDPLAVLGQVICTEGCVSHCTSWLDSILHGLTHVVLKGLKTIQFKTFKVLTVAFTLCRHIRCRTHEVFPGSRWAPKRRQLTTGLVWETLKYDTNVLLEQSFTHG